ncbi:DUF4198 domain-containing protein [Flagellimonas sp. 389]|uniref:DUF4198 domain-containing protein n=1 Tax=Flagellimonas sp. 389 TaxID=2835862 RepID=UPI001BD1EEF4|nr:DUF4198 domain-containing protein [Flagellimonas sp. 389]MBS9461519.1 DUF4198 domain-containing protein [Flagellimonas sp. 389]
MKRGIFMFFLATLLIVFSSHELFLKSDAYFLDSGQASELYLFNGTFDKSENTITRDRISDARIIGPDYEMNVNEEDYYDKENITYLKFTSGGEGTYAAGISTLPRMIELDADKFNEYLDHEGLEDVIEQRKKEGSFSSGAREKYSKHVKMLFQVGEERTSHFNTVHGFPIEFVPLENPYEAKAGESISFKLLSGGEPLTNHTVHYSTSVPGKDAHESENSTKTDNNGIVKMTPTQAGKWYVATIHMVKSDEKGVDYESNWTTLTFAVK